MANIKNPKSIDEYFDPISYSKGSCLIRGLVNVIGNEKFKKGMQSYMKNNAWNNTKSEDLWNALNSINLMSTSNDPTDNQNNIQNNMDFFEGNIKEFMNSWVKNVGYPVVKLDCDNMILTQFRYLKCGPNVDNFNDNTLWNIPISVEISNYGMIELLMDKKIKNLTSSLKYSKLQFVINPYRNGFYRVMYDMKNFSVDKLPFNINSLEHKVLSYVLDDAFALSLSGYQNLNIPMEILKKINLENVMDHNLWKVILSNMIQIEKILCKYKIDTQRKKNFYNFITNHIGPHVKNILKKINIEPLKNEPSQNEYLRLLFIKFLNVINNKELIEYARINFYDGKYKNILNIFIKNSSDKEFEDAINIFLNNKVDDKHIKNKFFESIEYINDEKKAKLIMSYVLNNKIRKHNIPKVIFHLSNNIYGNKIIWDYTKSQWNKCNIFNNNTSNFTSIIKAIGSGLDSENDLNDFLILFGNTTLNAHMTINQTIEKIRNKINYKQKVLELIQNIDF